tara:strand:+ start:1549 stop:2217 length:669 start_codon:yes stop_codon:yes gene_type:complete
MNSQFKDKTIREEIIFISRKMNSSGLNQGTSGNISSRINGGLLITPSSMPYEEMQPSDLVAIDFNGNPHFKNQRKPSSEWQIHSAILRERKEIGAILHCHSIAATALSCHEKPIPSFHYMTAIAGGNDIRCAPYATFGTRKLSNLALLALENRLACLLAHHGQISLGKNITNAFNIAVEVETLAKIYLAAFQLGEPPILGNSAMNEVHKQFKKMNYGIKKMN